MPKLKGLYTYPSPTYTYGTEQSFIVSSSMPESSRSQLESTTQSVHTEFPIADSQQSLNGQLFDFIFADTWSGKYRFLEEALALVSPSGLYVIDDMRPQPNWPEGHAEKVSHLISTLEHRSDFRITKMSWASGVILASKL
jgi:predicted O-methyltransferase YrrM